MLLCGLNDADKRCDISDAIFLNQIQIDYVFFFGSVFFDEKVLCFFFVVVGMNDFVVVKSSTQISSA